MTLELSTRGATIKTAYEAEPFTRVFGPGQGTGNVITKTLATSGGDFETFHEVMEYISGNQFDNAEFQLTVLPGTYSIAPTSADYIMSPGNGINKFSFLGSNPLTCIFEIAAGRGLTFRNSNVLFSNLGVTVADWEQYPTFCNLELCDAVLYQCYFTDLYGAVRANGGVVVLQNCSATNVLNDDPYIVDISYGGVCWVTSCTFEFTDNVGVAFFAGFGGHIFITGTTVENAEYAVIVDGSNTIVTLNGCGLTNNSSDYNIPVNEIQGYGSYISDGGPLTGAGDTKSRTTTITAAQLADLHNTPVELVPAPGAGKLIVPVDYLYVLQNADPAIQGSGSLRICYTDGSGPHLNNGDITLSNDDMIYAEDLAYAFYNSDPGPLDPADFENAPIVVSFGSDLTMVGPILTSSIGAAGADYEVGDELTLYDATITIDTVDAGGEVLTYTITDPGIANYLNSGQEPTGGSGTGFLINIDSLDYSVVPTTLKVKVLYSIFDIS